MTLSFAWPDLDGGKATWTGREFLVDGQQRAILDYGAGQSGWDDELTRFHEEVAGEGAHPIDTASRRCARAALKRHLNPGAVILEVGCSSGFLLRELTTDWPESLIIGSDCIAEPLDDLARSVPSLPLLRFDLVECPLPSASLDAVVMLNVLEHIERHDVAVQQVARVLKPGGIAVVEVPAGPDLFDVYDKYLKHFRRYSRQGLRELLTGSGLKVVGESYLGCLIYPAFALVKRRNRRWLEASEETQRRIVASHIRHTGRGRLIHWTTAIEERLRDWVPLPCGIRCLAVALKV
jgi:SAM-dependent methyltransferase